MKAVLIAAVLCLSAGTLNAKTSVSYKYYRGRYELKVKSPAGTRTYWGYGTPHTEWMLNPYAPKTNKTYRTGRTRSGTYTNRSRGSKLQSKN